MATNVTVRGQVTLPKAMRDAAGIRPGDSVSVRLRPEGGIIVEREAPDVDKDTYLAELHAIMREKPLRQGPFDGLTTDEIMQILRGDDD
jgi:AbrB family looped-hinge helix DNA binding protein